MPTFSHGTRARMWLDGFAASCYLNDMSSSTDIDAAETTTFCKEAKTYCVGLEDSTISLSGFYDVDTLDPTATFEAFLDARKRSRFPVIYAPLGDAPMMGDRVYLIDGILTSYNIGSTVDDALSIESEVQSSTGLLAGTWLKLPELVDDDGESVAIDNGDETENGFSAVLSVSKITGTTPELTVKLQDSDDDDTYVDVTGGAFDPKDVVGGQALHVSGTVRQYVRVVWTLTGTDDPTAEFNVAWRRN